MDTCSAESYAAICSDFYVNQRLSVQLDLPSSRDTLLDMLARIRKEFPEMERFRRLEGELALESPDDEARYSWLSLQPTSIRSGWVNPGDLGEAYQLHRRVLELVPFYLSISPLEVDFLELVFGFDVATNRNRNEVVMRALFADSPLARVVEAGRESLLDVQPFVGFALNDRCDVQASVEIKTRTKMHEIAKGVVEDEPISIYLTTRRYGPLGSIGEFASVFGELAGHAERLAEERVIPDVVMPIRAEVG